MKAKEAIKQAQENAQGYKDGAMLDQAEYVLRLERQAVELNDSIDKAKDDLDELERKDVGYFLTNTNDICDDEGYDEYLDDILND